MQLVVGISGAGIFAIHSRFVVAVERRTHHPAVVDMLLSPLRPAPRRARRLRSIALSVLRSRLATSALAGLTIVLAACGGGGDGGGGPKATALRLDPSAATLDIGTTLQLTATFLDNQGSVVVNTNATITWRSLAPTIATVDESGLVTTVAEGSASIEAKAGSLVGTASITVSRPPVGRVSIEPGTLQLARGGTAQLSAHVFTNADVAVTDRTVTWTSSNDSVVTVTTTGASATVTAKAPGNAKIRATSENITTEVDAFVGADPVIALSTTTVNLSLARLAAAPTDGVVQIANSSAGVLNALATSVTFAAGEPTGWLAQSLSSTTAPSTLTLRATAGSLGEGVYHATATVSTTLPAVAPKSVAVTLTVGPGPSIALSPPSVTLSTFAGAVPPPATAVTVSNGGGATLSGLSLGTVTWSGTPNWASFTVGATAPASLTITPLAAISTLPAGSYSATIPVLSSLSGVATKNLVVSLTVGAAPIITLTPPTVSFTAAVGGAAPASQLVTISNSGGGSLSGIATGAVNYAGGATGWLTPTLQNASSQSPTVLLAVSTAGLATGTYNASIPVTSTNTFVAAKQIDVTLNVGAQQVITIATPSISLTATQGGASPTPMSVALTNGGTGTLSGLSLDPTTYTGGSPGWMIASLAGTTAPTNISLAFATGALGVGTYTATVRAKSSIAGVIPAAIVVTLNVRSGATIALSSTSVTIQGLSGGVNPAPANVIVSNGAVGSLTGLSLGVVSYSGAATGWLNANIAGSTAPTSVSLDASIAGLSPGTYNASVPVQSNLAGVAPVTIAVTLVVNPATTMAVSTSNVTLNAPNGGGNPSPANVSVTNTGSNPLTGLAASVTYVGSPPTNWLTASVSPATAPATLTLSANVASLPSGTYIAQVSVSSPVATNSPLPVQVTLVVPPPTIALTTTSVSAVATQSTGVVSTQFSSVGVTNTGGGILQGIKVDSVHYNNSSATGWITTSVSPTRAPTTLVISVNTGAAAAPPRGTYTAAIWLSASGATNTPRVINASLTLVYTYDTHIAPLWTTLTTGVLQTCASSGCHDVNAPTTTRKIDLSTAVGDPYTRLLTLLGTGNVRYVLPNDPNNSLLYRKVLPFSGYTSMPPSGGRPFYSSPIVAWILDGARRN